MQKMWIIPWNVLQLLCNKSATKKVYPVASIITKWNLHLNSNYPCAKHLSYVNDLFFYSYLKKDRKFLSYVKLLSTLEGTIVLLSCFMRQNLYYFWHVCWLPHVSERTSSRSISSACSQLHPFQIFIAFMFFFLSSFILYVTSPVQHFSRNSILQTYLAALTKEPRERRLLLSTAEFGMRQNRFLKNFKPDNLFPHICDWYISKS